ncbi:hypothetical protein K469DRAFT_736478 [Zopfia rhizophila CBS 207.26]|uniref:HMG box domain-containing protein n=1 Tax=Zopfia rhizophila CBS 207.26 TaxID=1314779 RepID=A0A6A6EKU6_9PEZI|nr:hypothetical protein K469DRAFT_736478 [Zopfia rhizophila CBS 207.26]
MRFLTRLHALVGVAIIAILYFSWVLPSLHIKAQIQKVWRGSSYRLVVFGDDWSDVGEYRVSPPPRTSIQHRDPDRGELWTEVLCRELICDFIDNFARSMPSNMEIATVGSVVDSKIFANATADRGTEALAVFDFHTQVQQFINFEKQKRLMPGRLSKNEWTIFTIFFGIWDLWEYSVLDKAKGIHAIDRSIEELFHNLDILREHTDTPIKVVIPKLMDVTFLPRFQMRKNESTSVFAQDQHQSVFLWTYWNTALSQAAVEWGNGDIFMPDLNGIVMNQVRAKQLYSKHISDASGFGKQMPLFDDVEQPCVPMNTEDADDLQAADVEKCFEPGRHLFWDGMHLSGPAHKLIGRDAARLVRGNSTVNIDARERAKQGSATSQKDEKDNSADLRESSRTNLSRAAATPSRTKEPRAPSPAQEYPTRVTRKRAASLNDGVNGNDSVDADSPTDPRNIQSASLTGSEELSEHVCLCQPEPKIPRPRNAFILYRQHHQHAIVARNPGLANPEISKIIGEQWKAESDQEKKVWQDLAIEEKARHHEQYPDYRYQPRRQGKPLLPLVQHTTVDKYRCSRCGGRSIKTPTSPFPSVSGTPTLPLPNISGELTPTTRYLPMMNNLSLDSHTVRRRGLGLSNLGNIQGPSTSPDTAMYSPSSPDSKRRRYNYSTTSNGRRADGPYYTHAQRESLPPMRQSPPNTATMPPPRTPRRPSTDLGLLVPGQHDQSRSVEAMVMSVPYQVKVKVLGRITPPLKDPGPTSPAVRVRGAILAIEGDDTSAVQELADWLKDFLAKDTDYHPRIAQPPKGPGEDQEEVAFENYLNLIKDWHGRSKEMIQFITVPVTSDSDRDKGKDKDKSSPPSSETSSKPVIILPTYQLHASNTYTSRIPITDAYSPTDHWQWMATLWRGTVGPDLTIYVNNVEGKEGLGGKLVELNEEVRCLTVRREKGGRFEDSALRRVGFEVSEWIRGIGGKSG